MGTKGLVTNTVTLRKSVIVEQATLIPPSRIGLLGVGSARHEEERGRGLQRLLWIIEVRFLDRLTMRIRKTPSPWNPRRCTGET